MLCALLLVSGSAARAQAETKGARGQAEHVVLVVWDGMRPDFVTKENAPTLWQLGAGRRARFAIIILFTRR